MSAIQPPRLNVLMVNAQQTGGGAGRVGEMLAAGLREAGHAVHGFVRDNCARDPTCRQVGHWRTTALAQWLRGHGLPELGHVTSLAWACRPEFAAADVLHLHNIHGEYVSLAALPLWCFQKPVVWTLHDEWPLTGNCAFPYLCTRGQRGCGHCPQVGRYPMASVDRSRLYRWLKPRLLAAAGPRLVSPSRWLASRVRAVPQLARLPLRVIPNPVATDTFAPTGDRAGVRTWFGLAPHAATVIIAGCGWDDVRKGATDAVAALRQTACAVRGLQVLAVGPTAERLLSAAGLPGRALPFVQDRDTLAQAYACADVCLFPSHAENHPLTVLEAQACATPVVAYAVGGVPEQIEPGQTGLLARDGQIDELAAGLIQLLRHPDGAREIGRAAREVVVRTSSIAAVTAQYEDEYCRALHVWRRRRGRPQARYQRGRLGRFVARALGWNERPPTQTRRPAQRAPQLALEAAR